MSIRLRLTLWYSAILLLGLAIFGVGMFLALEHRLATSVDERLAQRIEGLRTVITDTGTLGRSELQEELTEFTRTIPEGVYIQLRDSEGPLLPKAIRPGASYKVLTAQIQYRGKTYDAFAATSLDDINTVMRDFRNLLWLMVPAVFLIACSGGYWISRTALAPVDEITSLAKSISVNNLSNRLAVRRTGDEIERMSVAWNEVLESLDSAVKRIRQFTADASHELRTPLALIRTTAEVALRRDRQPQEYQQSLLEILSEAERMTELTESLLTLARADSGAELRLSRTDVSGIVRDVVRRIAPTAAARNILLRAEMGDRPAIANANESGIRRLLSTLIENALKHTPSGGEIVVSADVNPNGVVLAVQDTGEGIQQADMPHIFERFFRADTARGSGDGVGLGLSIAQSIAQAHGSQIAVESEPGAGARFELLLRS